jgi:catechol 2,3-dioxygenase-like lactoylglutathione lyase family enzyme
MPVMGIGGFFFRSADPGALSAWYQTHLGILPNGDWIQETGPTVFAPFPATTDYFAPDRPFMLNLRVSDLDGLLANLEAAGIAIIRNPDWDAGGFGRFARIHDPQGNPIELWEAPAS